MNKPLIILLQISLISCTIYYADSKNGNDTDNGTIYYPFKTINACVSSIKHPGDECQLNAGTYHSGEEIKMSRISCTSEKPCKISAKPGHEHQVIIDGTVEVG